MEEMNPGRLSLSLSLYRDSVEPRQITLAAVRKGNSGSGIPHSLAGNNMEIPGAQERDEQVSRSTPDDSGMIWGWPSLTRRYEDSCILSLTSIRLRLCNHLLPPSSRSIVYSDM